MLIKDVKGMGKESIIVWCWGKIRLSDCTLFMAGGGGGVVVFLTNSGI